MRRMPLPRRLFVAGERSSRWLYLIQVIDEAARGVVHTKRSWSPSAETFQFGTGLTTVLEHVGRVRAPRQHDVRGELRAAAHMLRRVRRADVGSSLPESSRVRLLLRHGDARGRGGPLRLRHPGRITLQYVRGGRERCEVGVLGVGVKVLQENWSVGYILSSPSPGPFVFPWCSSRIAS